MISGWPRHGCTGLLISEYQDESATPSFSEVLLTGLEVVAPALNRVTQQTASRLYTSKFFKNLKNFHRFAFISRISLQRPIYQVLNERRALGSSRPYPA
jgi:hypothetical protein